MNPNPASPMPANRLATATPKAGLSRPAIIPRPGVASAAGKPLGSRLLRMSRGKNLLWEIPFLAASAYNIGQGWGPSPTSLNRIRAGLHGSMDYTPSKALQSHIDEFAPYEQLLAPYGQGPALNDRFEPMSPVTAKTLANKSGSALHKLAFSGQALGVAGRLAGQAGRKMMPGLKVVAKSPFARHIGRSAAPAAANAAMAHDVAAGYDLPGNPNHYALFAGAKTLLTRGRGGMNPIYRNVVLRPLQRTYGADLVGNVADQYYRARGVEDPAAGKMIRTVGLGLAMSPYTRQLARTRIGNQTLGRGAQKILGAATSRINPTSNVGRMVQGVTAAGNLGNKARNVMRPILSKQLGSTGTRNALVASTAASVPVLSTLGKARELNTQVSQVLNSDTGKGLVSNFAPEYIKADGTVDVSGLTSAEGIEKLKGIISELQGAAENAGQQYFGRSDYFTDPKNWKKFKDPNQIGQDYVNYHGLVNILRDAFNS